MQFREPPASDDDLAGGATLTASPAKGGSIIIAGLIAAVAAGAGPAYGQYLSNIAVTSDLSKLATPSVSQGWQAVSSKSNWAPSYPTADKVISQSYRSKDGETVDFAIAYYSRQQGDKELIRHDNRVTQNRVWQRSGDGGAVLDVDGQPTPVLLTRLRGVGGKRIVVRVYWVGGRFTASTLKAKIFQALGELLGGHRSAAAIMISTEYSEQESDAIAVVADFLRSAEAMAPLLLRPE